MQIFLRNQFDMDITTQQCRERYTYTLNPEIDPVKTTLRWECEEIEMMYDIIQLQRTQNKQSQDHQ